MARLVTTARPAPNSGRLRTTNWLHAIGNQINTNFASGGFPAIGALGVQDGVNSAGLFPAGAGTGSDGIANNASVGRAHIFFSPSAGLRDQYCAQTLNVRLSRPLVDTVNPFAVWEVEADVIMRLPAGAINGDLGLVLHGDTSVTGWGTDFTDGALGGIGKFGMALMAQGATNEIRAIARSATTGGFTVNQATGIISQPVGTVDRIRRLRIRLESATVAQDARCTWYVDDVAVHTLPLLAASGMPSIDLITGGVQWLGAFRAFLRNSRNNVSGAVLAYSHWRVSSAPTVAAMEA